jgi:PhnB protein
MREKVPTERHHLVMHAQMSIGSQVIMGADMPPDMQKPGGSISIAVNYDTPEEAERVFAALSDGATINMPIGPTFWAQRFGALTDKFGIPWLVNGGFMQPQS